MGRRWMFTQMLAASLTRRRSRIAIAFLAIVIGATVTSGLANVYYDIEQKMSRELRTFGANLVLTPGTAGQPYIPSEDIARIARQVDPAKLVGYVPYLYLTAEIRPQADGGDRAYAGKIARGSAREIVVVGTHLDRIADVSPYWRITGRAPAADRRSIALIGETVAGKLGITSGQKLTLSVRETPQSIDRMREVLVGGILTTGSDEDNQLFVDLDLAAELLDKKGVASAAHFSIVSSLDDLESFADGIHASFPAVAASPIMRISKAEGQVLDRIKALVFLAVALILVLTLLCVGITMTNMAVERRREIGLRKALGARDRDIIADFVAEGGALGLSGGLVGCLLGLPFAQLVGQSVFQLPVSIRPEVLPLSILFSAALAAFGSWLPARAAARVQPALTLKGE